MKKTYGLMVFLLFFTFIFSSCSTGGTETPPVTSAKHLKVFVTSESGTGDLSTWTHAGGAHGVVAGDNVCQAAATAAGLSGTYKAWLSDSNTDAYCHVQGFTGTISGVNPKCGQATLPVAAGPWVRTHDGFPFAPAIDKLVNTGQVYHPVEYDENGTYAPNLYYWTGTSADGTYSSACTDWTIGSGGNGQYASPDAASFAWTEYGGTTCNATLQLLCLQTGVGAPLHTITAPPSSKKVFVTSATGPGNLTTWADYSGIATGAAAGDTICKARAAAASIPNAAKFKAWLSDSTHDAKDRLTLPAGPWYRLDGVKVADDIAALIAAATTPILTAIAVDETGTYLTNYQWVWSGTNEIGINTPALNCVDWGNSATANHATIGLANFSNTYWTNWGTVSCNNPAALYCFEDN